MKIIEDDKKNIISENSKKYASQLWGLINQQIEQRSSENGTALDRLPPPKDESKHKWLIKLLFIFPIFLLIGFLFSFFWDFNGLRSTFFGYEFSYEGLLRILSISGLIGFLTNWLAINMLFKPAQRRPILGQGLIPAQKERIAFRLASAVSEDLINPEIIKRKIQESQAITKYREKATDYIKGIIDDPGFRDDLKKLAVDYVDEMIAKPEVRSSIATTIITQIEGSIEKNSFERVALKAYSFLKGQEMQDLVEEALTQLPGGVENGLNKMDDFLDKLPTRIEEHSGTIEDFVTSLLYKLINQLDVHALVEDNLREYDEKRLEKLIKNASNDQLQYIQYLGAVLGTLGGFIIWKPIASLILLGSIITITIGIDFLLIQLKPSK